MIEPSLRNMHSSAPINSRTLRQFAALWLLIVGGVAVWQGLLRERPGVGFVLGLAAVLFGVVGLARPSSIRWLFVGLSAITRPIGFAFNYLMLSAFFYFALWPLGLCFKLAGRDPLALRPARGGESYLNKKSAASDLSCYLRQS